MKLHTARVTALPRRQYPRRGFLLLSLSRGRGEAPGLPPGPGSCTPPTHLCPALPALPCRTPLPQFQEAFPDPDSSWRSSWPALTAVTQPPPVPVCGVTSREALGLRKPCLPHSLSEPTHAWVANPQTASRRSTRMEPGDGPEPNASQAQQSFVGKSAWWLRAPHRPPLPPSPSLLPGLSWGEPESPWKLRAASADQEEARKGRFVPNSRPENYKQNRAPWRRHGWAE